MFRFLINRISPTLITIAIIGLVLLVIFLVLRQKSKLFRTAIGLVALIGFPILIYSFMGAFKAPIQPMSSTAMFKKMEYIEHLKLVSFYSEEVLVLGTKEKVQKLVDKLQDELDRWDEELIKKDLRQIRTQQALDSVIILMVDDKNAFQAEKEQLKNQEDAYKNFKKCNLSNKCEQPQEFSEQVWKDEYARYEQAFISYQQIQDSLDMNPKPWKGMRKNPRRKMRKRIKDSVQARKLNMEDAHEAICRSLEREIEIAQKQFEDLKDLASDEKEDLKQAKKTLTDLRDESRREWKKALGKQQRVANKLREAQLELEFARESGEELDPEVLIVAPAEISVYINMKKLSMNVEELEDSVVRILIPPIEFDPTLIELPDSAVYEVDGNESELEFTRQGAYYDLFGQLKETVLEKQSEVKAKAIENGIITEGEKMAKIYLENFMRPLGLKLEFIQMRADSLPLAKNI